MTSVDSISKRIMSIMNLTTSMEDYLEAISILEEDKKYVRVRDIARHMKVKMPSVTGALKSLTERKLVNHERVSFVIALPFFSLVFLL